MILCDFECPKCRLQFEEFTESDPEKAEPILCPECKNIAKRLISFIKSKHVSWSTWRMDQNFK